MASGVLFGLAFPTWHLFPLAWFALVPLLVNLYSARPREYVVPFFTAGLAFYLVLLQWLLANVYWAGGWAIWGHLALSAFMALYWALTGFLWGWLKSRRNPAPDWLILALLWGGMELLQGRLFTGFGWGALAYSQGPDLMLLQLASVGGAPLIGAIIIAVNALIASIVVGPGRLRRAVTAALILVLAHGAGYALLDAPEYGENPYEVGLLQADFPLEMKWDPEYTVDMVANAAEKSRILAQEDPYDLLVWPESLVMTEAEDPRVRNILLSLAADIDAPLFTGTQRRDAETGNWRNSSVLVDPEEGIAGRYDKVHLAPFGEYVPLAKYLPFIGKVVPAIGNVEPGFEAAVLSASGRKLGPLICFEVLFPEMAEGLRRRGADMLVVITNLGWFGASNAIPQELEIARVRAIETRLPLVQSANTGISGVFDPWGRFKPVSGVFEAPDHFRRVQNLAVEHTTMQRMGDVLPIAQPARRLWDQGPRLVPWLMAAGAVLLIVWSAAASGRDRQAGR